MDARGVQRTLEKIQGMAETAEHVGMRMAEAIKREPGLSAPAKERLEPLYREHALRLMLHYASLGTAICQALEDQAEDNTARGLLDLFRANFASMRDRAQDLLRREIGGGAKLT